MPWEIRQGTSQCSGYGVFKEGTSELEGCHTTRAAAERQMAALYASEPEAAEKEVVTNESTPNLYPQSIGSGYEDEKKKKRRFIDTTKSMHDEDELYNMLTPEEKAYHDALVRIAGEYGPFDQGTSSIWVGYEAPAENEDAAIGVKCGNCSMHYEAEDGGLGCMILSYKVQENAKCRLAAIPDGLVNPQNSMPTMNRNEQQEFVDDMMERIGKTMNEDLEQAKEILKSLEKGYKDKEKAMHEDEEKSMHEDEEEKSMHEDEEEEMKEKGYKDKQKSIDSDSAAQAEVPADLSAIFTNMPRTSTRANSTGNAKVSFPLFRDN